MQHIQWIFSGIGVLAISLLVAWLVKRRQHATASNMPPEAEPKRPKNLKSFQTVHRIALGEFADAENPVYEVGIHLLEIRMERRRHSDVDEPVAVVNVRHHAMYPGTNVQTVENGFRYVMPQAVLEPQDSIFAFSVKGEYYWYLVRAVIKHINHHAGWIDVEFSGFHARE